MVRCVVLLLVLLIGLAQRIYSQNVEQPDSIMFLLKKAIKEKNNLQESYYTYKLASAYVLKGDTENALKYAQKAVKLAEKNNQDKIKIEALSVYARVLSQKGKLDESIKNYENACKLAKEAGDTILYAHTLENLGIVYGSAGKTDWLKSLEFLLKAAKLKEMYGAWSQLPGTYKRISSVFRETDNNEKRELYLLKAVQLVDSLPDVNPMFKAAIYNEAGRYYTDENIQYKKAIEIFNKVLDISTQLGWKRGIAVSKANIANVYENTGELETSLKLHKDALSIKKEINDVYGMIKSYESVASVYMHQKEYRKAINTYRDAEELALSSKLTNELKEVHLGLYKANKASGNIPAALSNYEKYTELSDSIKGENHKKVLTEMETKYETEKKEQKIFELTKEKEIEALRANQRKLITIVLSIFLIILIIVFILINRERRLKTQKNESELRQRLLRLQMNPHFIFNALGSIQNYIHTNEAKSAEKYLVSFSKLMRDILESSSVERIPLEQELRIVENYLILQKMRKGDLFEYSVEIPEDTDEYLVPPMFAQPFIENSTIHAFKGIDYQGHIKVTYKAAAPWFIIQIEDNGVGLKEKQELNKSHKSMAISLTLQRLKLFNDKKLHSKLEFNNHTAVGNKGVCVAIFVPLEKCLKF